jgi:hypothetical protein
MTVLSPRLARVALPAWIAFSIAVCAWVGWLVTRG